MRDAREAQADKKLFKECLEIADKATPENVSVARLQVDTRKWAAARLAPKKYGDRISHDVHGSTNLNFQPAVLIKIGDGTATRFEDVSAPKGRWRSTRRQRGYYTGALTGRRTWPCVLRREPLAMCYPGLAGDTLRGSTNASIQNNSGLPQGLAGVSMAG